MNCLEQADFERFAPIAKSTEDMNTFYKEAEMNLISLGKYF
jgi:hypothetical protein